MKTKTDIYWTFHYCPQPDEPINWEAIEAEFDWIREMKDVPQDPIYHAEGDVLIHTKMVLEELIKLAEWQNLPERERNIVFLACLLHDVAKPICTQTDENGRISSPKHARIGEMVARNILYQNAEQFDSIGFEDRELICKLVRYHGLPLWFLEKRNTEKAVLEASLSTPMDLLALVAEADVRGRICEDQQELLDKFEYFRMYCQEQKCYNQPKTFTDNYTRFLYFYKEENISPDYPMYDETIFEVILLCGLPGAGKDTYIRENLSDLPVISLDEIRKELGIDPKDNQGQVIQEGQERAKKMLRKQQPFVWNATNLQKDRRAKLIDLFYTYKARTKIVYVESTYKSLLYQNQNREEVVPLNVVHRMMKKAEIPAQTEAYEIVYHINP